MSRFTTGFQKIILVFPLFLIIPAIILLSLLNKPLAVFPGNQYKDRISFYADDELGGNSRIIDYDVLDNNIIFTYMLKKSKISSFAGLSIDVSLLDISSYDIMELHLTATLPARYLVNLMSFKKGESRLSELDTIVHFNKEINVKEASQVCKMDLNDLIKTEYRKGNSKKGHRVKEKPTNLLFIHLKEMVNVDNIEENSWSFDKIKTIIIEEISFHKSYFHYYVLLVIFFIIYYTLYLLFLLFRKRPGKAPGAGGTLDLPLIQLNVETYQEEDLKKIMNTLQQNVFDPEFSIHTVYDITGQSEIRIAKLIKEKYDLSFKQLINSIRLNEAKRLLLKSDLKIYDIAFKIGYNNNTYFCKLFKKQFGFTPKEFRTGKKL